MSPRRGVMFEYGVGVGEFHLHCECHSAGWEPGRGGEEVPSAVAVVHCGLCFLHERDRTFAVYANHPGCPLRAAMDAHARTCPLLAVPA